MGFFSWDCKRCGHPMLSEMAVNEDRVNAWMTDVVVLYTDGERVSGVYDGYGRVSPNGYGEGHAIDTGRRGIGPACWHRSCYEVAGRPCFESESESSDDQGWFFDDTDHAMPDPKGGVHQE